MSLYACCHRSLLLATVNLILVIKFKEISFLLEETGQQLVGLQLECWVGGTFALNFY